MNPRIRELLEQSTEVHDHWHSGKSVKMVDYNQFAELILQDCFDILCRYRGKVIWLNEDVGHNHPILEIKKHFGVRE